ncbi:amino acid adenylation domain-containing protein [Aquabacterium sp. A7-Y]|nr:non-ribosomal peptide synthetase [Aquabacterium sp. A7-Y]MCW7537502.1 amino acid adenylation domain-containing protein [Aquabacterium sp. A7-Y]
MAQRLAVVARDLNSARSALRAVKSSTTAAARPRLVFLFPGQGSQHPGMARGLYDEAPAFREALDRCLAVARSALDVDLKAWLVTADPADRKVAEQLAQTRHAQPALFAVSHALAAWLDSLGLQPQAMIGHSIGEYAAACHAGVFSVEDAMRAVIARGQAMYEQPPGAMLAVRAPADTLRPLLPEGIEIAGHNAPALCVVAGGCDAIERFALELEAREIGTTRLRVSHAFHSAAMDAALPRVAAALQPLALRAPRLPVYSCVSGALLQTQEATDPQYWARQVRASVQFHRAVANELAQPGETVFVEVGPGQALTALLRQHRTAAGGVPRIVPLLGPAQDPGDAAVAALGGVGALWCAGAEPAWPVAASARRVPLPTYPYADERHWFARRPPNPEAAPAAPAAVASAAALCPSPAVEVPTTMSRLSVLVQELTRILSDVSGLPAEEMSEAASFVDQGLDSLSLTQATLELERVFGVKLRFRRLLEDLDTVGKLARFLDAELPAGQFAPPPAVAAATPPAAAMPAPPLAAPAAAPAVPMAQLPAMPAAGTSTGLQLLIQQQMQLMSQQLALLAGQPPVALPDMPVPAAQPAAAASAAPVARAAATAAAEAAQPSIKALVEKPFGASARITLEARQEFTPEQRRWLDDFIRAYNGSTGGSKRYSQQHRKVMADPRVVTGFNPLWKDLVYPIVVDRSKGSRLWDVDGNEYIDLLSCFGGNLLGYQPESVVQAMSQQLQLGLEVGPQHPLAGEVAQLISEFTGMERVAFCNTGSEAVMGAMRVARTVTGRKTIAIFTNSYHGIFDEVIVRGTRQLRSLSAAPGILASAVENILVLDYASDESLRVLRERAHELAAIMIEPIQNKIPTLQPREFVQSLREIADAGGCALIFDEVVTGFRVAPGGAQEFYGVRADIATYGKVIGGGLPFAAIAGSSRWLDALDGGHWQYGDESYPEAGVTYFAGTFVRHPLALAASHATLLHLKRGGREFYRSLNDRTQRLVERLNTAFAVRGAPVKAVHCASLWRLHWDDNQKYVSLFYYLARHRGLHLYEQFGHFVTEAMGEADTDRIFQVFTDALDELMALGFILPRDGTPPPPPRGGGQDQSAPPKGGSSHEGPLSPGQTERWLAAGYDSHARRALNESLCISLRGAVDIAALKMALQDVLGRHSAFSIRFDLEEPRQRLEPAAVLPVQEIDLRQQPDSDAALDAFCSEASARDFPLDSAPLAAASLLRLADGRVVVHLVASHLVFDGWASSVFNAELATAYRARSHGIAPTLPPAESPIVFARQELERLEGPAGREALQFWQGLMQPLPARLELGDRTPPAERRYAADTLRTRFDGELLARLRSQARQSGATLFQLLLSALTLMLRREAGQDDFLVSIPYASQSLQRRGPLMADGVLDLPLRLSCRAGDSGAGLLQRVRGQLMDALEQPLMTQGTLARALGLRSAGNRPALTGVFFNLNPRIDLSAFAPLQATMHEGRKRGSLSELFFNFYEQDDALTLDLHYSTELFSPQRAQALVEALSAAGRQLAEDLNGPLELAQTQPAVLVPATEVPTTRPSDDVDARLRAWNATETPLAETPRVEAWIAEQAQRTPDAVALVAPGGPLSYRELDARANRYAHLLGRRGIGPGALVGLCLGRGPELLPALLGVLKAGAAYVPLDPGFPRDRLQYMAEDAELRLVITESAHASLAGLPREAQLRIDDDAAEIAAAPDQPPAPLQAPPDAPAYVIYTSGSTGRPKGVVLPQRAVCNFLASMRREPGLQAGDRLLAVTTLSFDIAVLELLLPLTVGARVVLAQREDTMDGEALAGLIADHRINVMQATPTTWHLLLDAGWRAPAGFRALCGGEPLPPALAARLLAQGVELWNMYGPTETTVWSTLARIHDAGQRITVGRPIANTQVWILDEQQRPCPVGAEGEICIGGAGVATGYFKRPELTAERFVSDRLNGQAGARLYRTGDLGRWREDGSIEHLGRLDFQVKIRGYRIELGEIESRLDAEPGIARSVVVAREDQPGDVRLVAYLVTPGGGPVDEAALRTRLKQSLPDYMLPAQVVTLSALPLLPNGKIDRKALPAPVPSRIAQAAAAAAASLAATAAAVPSASPQEAGPSAAAIAELMAEVLGRPSVAEHDNFFELGGHSLLAARLAARLGQQLQRRIGLKALFEAPTPASLAAALGAQKAQAGPATALRIPARTEQGMAPLSLMQQRLWFLEEAHPGTAAHNVPSAHRLSGPLNLPALEQALQQMVDRQAALRTWLERTPEGPVQRVAERLDLRLPLSDLRGLPAAEREAALQAQMTELVRTPIPLEQGPLFRARLYRLGDQEHVLFFMAHHVVFDGWSFDLLYRELSALYRAASQGVEAELPALPVSYGDFSAWQRDWMLGEELERQTAHWRERLTPLPEPIELPIDRPRPPAMSGRGGSHHHYLSRDLTDQLHALAQRHGRTLYVALLAAYSALLHRMTGQTDLVVGTPVRGREQPELEGLMGFFVNALPLRLRPAAELGFGEWMRRVHEVVVDAFAYPDVPFEHLVHTLKVPRDPSRPLIYQVMFSFQDARDRPLGWGELKHQRVETALTGASEELSLWCVETPQGVECAFTYAADLFTPQAVARIAERFETLLKDVVADAARTLGVCRVASDAEQATLAAWNRTEAEVERGHIARLLERQAARCPDAVALSFAGQRLSYAELDGAANCLAHQLRARGARRGTLVGLCLERSIAMVVAQLAILKCGAAYVPLDPAYPAERLAYMVEDAKLTLLVSNSALTDQLSFSPETTLRVDAEAAEIAGQPATPLPDDHLAARAEDPAYVIYTSGSTGRPKGVVVPHRAVLNFLTSMAHEPGLAASDRLIAVTTLSFDIAVLELLLPLSVGAQVVLASRDEAMDGRALRGLIETHSATVMQATPSTWQMLMEAGWEGSPGFKALVGGEALSAELATQLLARSGELWNMYGPTETTVWSTCCKVEAPERGISIGKPIANTSVWVLDERQQPCPIGVPGEIWIGGDGVTLGYLQRPELTAERFVAHRGDGLQAPAGLLYRTGDRGRWRHDGLLEHLGRLDFQVKVRGHRIELGEIESTLLSHPGVSRAVVMVREDRPRDQRLVAYLVARDELPPAGELREHLRQALPDYMLPQHYVRLDALPLLPNGKVDRKALPPPPESEAAPLHTFAAPRTEREIALAEIWERLLGIRQVGVTDNFFDLGGHSLLAMRAVTEAEKVLHTRINVRRFIFETLGQLAATPADTATPAASAAAGARKPWLNRVLGAIGLQGRTRNA